MARATSRSCNACGGTDHQRRTSTKCPAGESKPAPAGAAKHAKRGAAASTTATRQQNTTGGDGNAKQQSLRAATKDADLSTPRPAVHQLDHPTQVTVAASSSPPPQPPPPP